MKKTDDTASNDPSDYDLRFWVNIALKELQEEGLIYDTGKRRKGRIVWKLTPAGFGWTQVNGK
jgi:hypothetical protein